ncbi:hypothetical protein [Kribbella deserti]|uniref:Uncharacterized protein n=1 Tax=Kribbella deserti TaxID=1926257 RepID=A0ABV6QF04_9ACTN
MSTVQHHPRPDAQLPLDTSQHADHLPALLELVAGDPLHERDREKIVTAIHSDAQRHNGHVSSNRVRRALTNEHGYVVYPRLIGAAYASLARHGALKAAGWELNDDVAGGNNNKPARCWILESRWCE